MLRPSMSIDNDVRVFQPVVHTDARGLFFESYNKATFSAWLGENVEFVQDNHSESAAWVIRGLHYQVHPRAQAKLVRVTRGSVFDVVVDVERSSATFGEWRGFHLSAENRHQLWVPEGYAHGFLALADRTEVQYKLTAPHSRHHERCILWNDREIGIEWPLDGANPVVGSRDSNAPTLSSADLYE